MKFIGRLVLGVIAIVVVVFALANRGPVTLSLWPLPIDVILPIYIAVLGAVVLGLLAGGAISWLPRYRSRRNARSAVRRADSLERAATAAATASTAALPPARYRPALNDD